jgi:hypothetical protein
LERERDSSYADLKKMKGKYDSVCQEVENKRKKTDGGQKGQLGYQQQLSEMRNVKVRSHDGAVQVLTPFRTHI